VQALSPDFPLEEQLLELEDLYAECLMNDADTKILSGLWDRIKEIRKQLAVPIYDFVTPKELRQ